MRTDVKIKVHFHDSDFGIFNCATNHCNCLQIGRFEKYFILLHKLRQNRNFFTVEFYFCMSFDFAFLKLKVNIAKKKQLFDKSGKIKN